MIYFYKIYIVVLNLMTCFQRNVALGNQEELERVIKQYTYELRKEEYRLARRNYTNKCIELTVKYHIIL